MIWTKKRKEDMHKKKEVWTRKKKEDAYKKKEKVEEMYASQWECKIMSGTAIIRNVTFCVNQLIIYGNRTFEMIIIPTCRVLMGDKYDITDVTGTWEALDNENIFLDGFVTLNSLSRQTYSGPPNTRGMKLLRSNLICMGILENNNNTNLSRMSNSEYRHMIFDRKCKKLKIQKKNEYWKKRKVPEMARMRRLKYN
jgi:hypothetical protein